MIPKYHTLMTNKGTEKLAAAAASGGQLKITAMAVGDGSGTLPTPKPENTKLVNEQYRGSLNQLFTDQANPHHLIAELIIPEQHGGWWIREVALFDNDGDMVAAGNCPESYKPKLQEGSGRTQIFRMVLIISNTSTITLKTNPSVVLATHKYVTETLDKKIKAIQSSCSRDYQPKGNYALKNSSYTKTESDSRWQPKGRYQPAGDYLKTGTCYTKTESDQRYQQAGYYQPYGHSYSKAASDERYISSETNIITNIRVGSRVYLGPLNSPAHVYADRIPQGAVLIGAYTDGDNRITGVHYAYLQYQIDTLWCLFE
ncbi:phage tail protein [Morganella morganii subsp. morganii]|uniref:phage tail protein n=1 Tax=Morganella morganii TaxID=582 RepID=UPI001BDADF6A|nr:phage tail protein [Morganella morganii subsp. morganii]